jgi:hypothetical protein
MERGCRPVVDLAPPRETPMKFSEQEPLPLVFQTQEEIDAEFEELDKEKRRAADFVANIAGVIEDIRSKN